MLIKCKEDQSSFVTTMIDFYALPLNFPGQNSLPSTADPLVLTAHLEAEFAADIGCRNFIPNLLVHEFEGLLYSDPDQFSTWFDESVVKTLQQERLLVTSPEHINNNPKSAPSKRLLRHCSGYDKILHGSCIALDIGLDKIRQECTHFNRWIERLIRL